MAAMETIDHNLVGMIVSSFTDSGPNIIFNNTDLHDDEAMILAIKGMTVIGLDNPLDAIEDINNDEERRASIQQFGPFPVKERENLKAMAISFIVKAEGSTDRRITTFGRFCVLFLIYNVEYTRLILDSYGLIEPYFHIISKEINYDKDLSSANLSNVFTKMNMLFQGIIPRVFTVTDKGVIKELIGKEIMHRDVFLIADKKKNKLFILLADPEMVIWRKHEINRAAANLNSHLFKKKLVVETVTELADIASLLKKFNLSVEGISQV